MAKNNIRLDTPQQKEIYSRFRYLADRHSAWQVWADFVTMSACSLSLADREQHMAEYASIAKRYKPEELQRLCEMFALTVIALDENPNQDFLGDLFMRFDLGNTWKGQFFTPYSLCKAMARMSAGDLKAQVEEKHWIHSHDPACGAGATLIAFANECRDQGVNYQTSALFVAQDIDRTAALMCYVQLSLLGCPGYVVVGDSLCNPVTGPMLFPQRREGQEIWYTPMFFSDIWQFRRQVEIMRSIFEKGESA
ncbi:MAG: SAM-dependent methyltransferase [Dysosmobacter sp.]|nr:SAM-dependent methyltransferase [Dysosmobacter sp.]